MTSDAAIKFIEGIGLPSKREEAGIKFKSSFDQMMWDDFQNDFGSGYFLDGFLYLFGEQLPLLDPCVEAWSFLLNEDNTYLPIGFNKMGAILLAVNFEKDGFASKIVMMDPLSGSVWENPQVIFLNMIGNYLPTRTMANFTDDKFYKAYIEVIQEPLEFSEIMAIKVPLTLGGAMEASNFQVENIVDYYQSTGKIYSKYNNDEEQ